MAPEGGPARVVDAPPDGPPVWIRHEIVPRVEFDPIAVTITQVHEQRVRHAVPARPALEGVLVSGAGHDVTRAQHRQRISHPKPGVVQPGSPAVHQGDVVYVVLAVQPRRPELRRAVICLRVLRTPKTPLPRIPFIGGLYVGNLHVHMVEAHDVGAAIEVETLQLPFYLINLVIELDGQSGGILHPQRLPLPCLFARLDPARREATRRAAAVQTLQIVRCRDAEGEVRDTWRGRLAQHQAVMVALFQTAQVDSGSVTSRLHQPQQVDVKRPCPLQVCDTVLDVTQPYDLGAGLASIHGSPPSGCGGRGSPADHSAW